MENIIKVGMADLQVAGHPAILTTLGLGSCVGIALFDSSTNVVGLAHAMLPDSSASRNSSNLAKFVDSSIDTLIAQMLKLGANRNKICAKLAGGAQMFVFANSTDMMRIGHRNVLAAKEKLEKLRIHIVAEDTGGNFGRTIELDSSTGLLMVRSIGYGIKRI